MRPFILGCTYLSFALCAVHLREHIVGVHANPFPSWLSTAITSWELDAFSLEYSFAFEDDDCSAVGGLPEYIGDGQCDIYNANEECSFDGGDCCECTCVDGKYACGSSGYYCIDPVVSDDYREESEGPSATSYLFEDPEDKFLECQEADGSPEAADDGSCDARNNNKQCDWDGGDCCVCTCEDTEDNTCGSNNGYHCEDPGVPQECRQESGSYVYPYPTLGEYPYCREAGGTPKFIGDGYCQHLNSIEECGYDGGDCCVCTCGNLRSCGGYQGFYCRDPTVSEECRRNSVTSANDFLCNFQSGHTWDKGNGVCDLNNNNGICGYDGGDCCSCTCIDTETDTCGESGGYFCLDPWVSPECVEESAEYVPLSTPHYYKSYNAYPECHTTGGHPPRVGNGNCDSRNNIEACDYDGGDCCICTCVDGESYMCGESGIYTCLDPRVSTSCREESASFIPGE